VNFLLFKGKKKEYRMQYIAEKMCVCMCISVHYKTQEKMKPTYLSSSTGYYFTDPNENAIKLHKREIM